MFSSWTTAPVMSTNIQILKYLNKMALKYYSYLYLCHFCTNIFRYSFSKYVASEYIRIFVWYIMWNPNIFGYLFVSILCYSLITAVYFIMYTVYCILAFIGPLGPKERQFPAFTKKNNSGQLWC